MPKTRMSLQDFVQMLEQGDRMPELSDFEGVRGKDFFGERLSSDQLRDLYAEGLTDDSMLSVDVPSTTMRRFPSLESVALERQLASEGLPADILSAVDEQVSQPVSTDQLREMLKGSQVMTPEQEAALLEHHPAEFATDPTSDPGSRFSRTPAERKLRKGVPKTKAGGSRQSRYRFESKPGRPSFLLPELAVPKFGTPVPGINPQGVVRGQAGDIHATTMAAHIPELSGSARGVKPLHTVRPTRAETRFWDAYQQYSDVDNPEIARQWEEGSGFTGREGSYMTRAQYAATHGRGETIRSDEQARRLGASTMIGVGRAQSMHEPDQVRRALQARAAQGSLAALREERVALESMPSTPANIARNKYITRAMGKLKNFAIRRGLMGIGLAATVGSNETVRDALDFGAEEAYGIE